jgi:hypothetical protein
MPSTCGADLRREPIEVHKATLASILRKARHGVPLNEHPVELMAAQDAGLAWKRL